MKARSALIHASLLVAALTTCGAMVASAQDTFHITHQYANMDARSMIGLPMGNHKTIVTKDGQLLWSQWSLANKGRAVNFGFSDQLDGALGIHLTEIGGAASKPLVAGYQHLDGMRFPFIVTEWKGNALTAEETAFAVSDNKLDRDVVQIKVTNQTDHPQAFELKLDGRQRNLPAFAAGSHLATRDGKLLAMIEPENAFEHPSTESNDLTLAARHDIPARGSFTFWIEVPYDLAKTDEGSLASPSGATLLGNARQSWVTLWSQGTQLDLPAREKELSDFYQASVAYLLMLTERDEKGELWTLDGPAIYREFWGRGEYFQGRAIEFAGYLPIALETAKHTFSLQKADGEWDWPVTSGWPAWDNIGGNAATVWDYYLLTRDKEWLRTGYPYIAAAANWINLHREETMVPANAPSASQPIDRQIPWKCTTETSPPLKPGEKPYWWGLLPWSYGDSGLPEGHPFPHNTWGLYAVKIAEQSAQILGHQQDAEKFAHDYADYKQAYFDSMRRSIALEKEDAPYLPAMPTDPGAGVSQSLIAVYPTHLISPDDLWVTNLLAHMRKSELQGLPTHMAWMGAGGVWPSESMNVAETYLRRGNIDKTVDLLIATLNHTYTTDDFKEEIKIDKSLPVACASGVSKDVPNGDGTGDQPEAWGPANLILLVRDMIFYEDSDALHILAGIPSNWIAPGEHLAIASAPSTLGGKVSLRLEYPQSGKMHMRLESRVAVPQAIVRFPLPANANLRSVSVNGQRINDFKRDTVQLKNLSGPTEIDAEF